MSTEEVKNKFLNDVDALAYFEHLRWGDKLKCAYCQSEKISARQIDNRFHCSSCRRTFSVTAGTFLHGSKIPLKSWLHAFASLSNGTGKFSIRKLQRDINVSYTTAWQMYQNLKGLLPEDRNMAPMDKFEYMCRKAISVDGNTTVETTLDAQENVLLRTA